MKEDEKQLLKMLLIVQRERHNSILQLPMSRWIGIVAESFRISGKRATYLLQKWSRKGWWEYGISIRAGWLTTEGIGVAESLV